MATISRKKETDGGMDSKALMTTLMAFQNGDFSARIPGDLTGVHAKIADTLNTIIDQSNEMVVEFIPVSNAIGRDGKLAIVTLSGQAQCYRSAAKPTTPENTRVRDTGRGI